MLQKPLTAQSRAFTSLSYDIEGWKFGYTVSYSSNKKSPYSATNHVECQQLPYSPAFATADAQISKTIGKKIPFDVYVGSENLTNCYQKNTIIAASQSFSQYFNASLIWIPITGRMLYAGMRFNVK